MNTFLYITIGATLIFIILNLRNCLRSRAKEKPTQLLLPRALLVESFQAACDENVKLREALGEIQSKRAAAGQGHSFLASDMREIARAALQEKP
jgi:hypothetical protein